MPETAIREFVCSSCRSGEHRRCTDKACQCTSTGTGTFETVSEARERVRELSPEENR